MSRLFRPILLLTSLTGGLFLLWFVFPFVVSAMLEQWLQKDGSREVSIVLGRPGWGRFVIPEVNIIQAMEGERLAVRLREGLLEFSLAGLLSGRCDRVVLGRITVDLDRSATATAPRTSNSEDVPSDEDVSVWNMLTVGDLVRGLPDLPFSELIVSQLTLSREQASGPLRHVVIVGSVRQRAEGLLAEMVVRGEGTEAYALKVSDLSTYIRVIQLETLDSLPKPLMTWRSEAVPGPAQTQLRGMLDLHVQELAPFVALAAPIGSEWRQVSGRVQASWEGAAPSDVPVTEVWRDKRAHVQGTLRVGVTLPEWKKHVQDVAVTATGHFSGNASTVRWTIEPGTLVSAIVTPARLPGLAPWRPYLLSGSQTLRVRMPSQIQGELTSTAGVVDTTVSGPITLAYGDRASAYMVEGTLQQAQLRGATLATASAEFLVQGDLPPVLRTTVGVRQASGQIQGKVSLDGESVQGTVTKLSGSASEWKQAGLGAERLMIAATDLWPFRFNARSGAWSLGASTFTVGSQGLQVQQLPVEVSRILVQLQSVKGAGASWDGQAAVNLHEVVLRQAQAKSLESDWVVRVSADQWTLKGEMQARPRGHPMVMAAEVQHDWGTQRGTLHGTTSPIQFDRTGFRLQQVLTPWPYPFDVTDGTLSVSLDLTWEPDPHDANQGVVVKTGAGEITIDRLAAQFRETLVSGVSTAIQFKVKGLERVETVKPAVVTIASVNPGVPVTNLSMTLQGEWDRQESLPTVELRELRCELLGGQMTSQGVRAVLTRPPYAFNLLVRQLDLQQILGLEQQQNVQGSGLLDGTVPVTVTSKGVIVKDGQFEARPPGGTIRYRASPDAAKSVTQANANMQLVLQALSNFHYTVLHAGVQYAEDGLLHLQARLEGRNPEMKNSPPIHFNLNIQENIPALLKSLRLVQDIEDSVQKKFVRP